MSALRIQRHHSNTSSAATSRPDGTVRPSARAVFRLTVVSYLVGASAAAPRRYASGWPLKS